jgi:hypothetical protein
LVFVQKTIAKSKGKAVNPGFVTNGCHIGLPEAVLHADLSGRFTC